MGFCPQSGLQGAALFFDLTLWLKKPVRELNFNIMGWGVQPFGCLYLPSDRLKTGFFRVLNQKSSKNRIKMKKIKVFLAPTDQVQ